MACHEVMRSMYFMAEGVGFEPTVPLRGLRFSRPVHSTALPPFHVLARHEVMPQPHTNGLP